MKSGRNYDLRREIKGSVRHIEFRMPSGLASDTGNRFGGLLPKVYILGTNCEFSVYRKKWIKSSRDREQRRNQNCLTFFPLNIIPQRSIP